MSVVECKYIHSSTVLKYTLEVPVLHANLYIYFTAFQKQITTVFTPLHVCDGAEVTSYFSYNIKLQPAAG